MSSSAHIISIAIIRRIEIFIFPVFLLFTDFDCCVSHLLIQVFILFRFFIHSPLPHDLDSDELVLSLWVGNALVELAIFEWELLYMVILVVRSQAINHFVRSYRLLFFKLSLLFFLLFCLLFCRRFRLVSFLVSLSKLFGNL